MALIASGWTVVVVGRWNPAILTPAGIAQRLFKLPEGENRPLRIEVPLDGVSPYRVRHADDNVVVMVNEQRLIIEAATRTYATLAKAMEVGVNALNALPETPFSASGFNIHFTAEDLCQEIIPVVASPLDSAVVDNGYAITKRLSGRAIPYRSGEINLTLTQTEKETTVLINFHRGSDRQADLIEWLQMGKEQVQAEVAKIASILKVPLEEQAK
jgi:hypothetical protein